MTQTTTGIAASNASIRITDSTGALRDISGSSNKLEFSGLIPTSKKYVMGSAWPGRYQGGHDASVKIEAIYSTAADEAFSVLKGWYLSPIPGVRLASIGVSDTMDFIASISDVSFSLPAGDGGPVIASFTLKVATQKAWWLANDTIPEANCIIAHSPYGAATLAASYINLAHPGINDAVKPIAYNSPTLDAILGWVFDGATTCLHSFNALTGPDYTMIVSYSTPTSTGRRTVAGKYQTSTNEFAIVANWGGNEMWAWHGNRLETAPILTSGTYAIAGNLAYRNGSAEAGVIPSPGSQYNIFYIGALGAGTIGLEFWPGSIKRIAVYDITLTPAQIAVLHTEMV